MKRSEIHEKVGRFAQIEEDVQPFLLLDEDYRKFRPFVRTSR